MSEKGKESSGLEGKVLSVKSQLDKAPFYFLPCTHQVNEIILIYNSLSKPYSVWNNFILDHILEFLLGISNNNSEMIILTL